GNARIARHGDRHAAGGAPGVVHGRDVARHRARENVPGRPVAHGHGGPHRVVHRRGRADADHRAVLAGAAVRAGTGEGMMTNRWSGWLLSVAALCAAGPAIGENVRDQFAYAARVSPWPGAPLQWFELPMSA